MRTISCLAFVGAVLSGATGCSIQLQPARDVAYVDSYESFDGRAVAYYDANGTPCDVNGAPIQRPAQYPVANGYGANGGANGGTNGSVTREPGRPVVAHPLPNVTGGNNGSKTYVPPTGVIQRPGQVASGGSNGNSGNGKGQGSNEGSRGPIGGFEPSGLPARPGKSDHPVATGGFEPSGLPARPGRPGNSGKGDHPIATGPVVGGPVAKRPSGSGSNGNRVSLPDGTNVVGAPPDLSAHRTDPILQNPPKAGETVARR